MTVLSLALSFVRFTLARPSLVRAVDFFFSLVSHERRKEEGHDGVDGERKSRGEGRSFVCGRRGVLGQLGAEVSRCVWYATVSCVAPFRPT